MKYFTRPLSGWDGPRTSAKSRRSRWTFKADWADTLDLLERELQYLAAVDVVLEADFREQDLRLDGMPRSNAREPVDPGVRLSFGSKHGPLIYQADSCVFWQHNVRSIALGLEALRAVDRYGITHRAEQYSGWKQIGAGPSAALVQRPPMDRTMAMLVIAKASAELPGHFDADRDLARYRETPAELDRDIRLAQRRTHPDTGGDAEAFDAVQRAVAILRGGAQ